MEKLYGKYKKFYCGPLNSSLEVSLTYERSYSKYRRCSAW